MKFFSFLCEFIFLYVFIVIYILKEKTADWLSFRK